MDKIQINKKIIKDVSNNFSNGFNIKRAFQGSKPDFSIKNIVVSQIFGRKNNFLNYNVNKSIDNLKTSF